MTLSGRPLRQQEMAPRQKHCGDYVDLLSRMLVGAVLFYAGFMKAMGPAGEFAAAIEAYKILPAALITPMSHILPWIEMWLGIFLICGYAVRLSAGAAASLFAVFFGAMISVFVRGLILTSCGCFGADALPPHLTAVLDGVLFLSSLWMVLKTSSYPFLSLDAWIEGKPAFRR